MESAEHDICESASEVDSGFEVGAGEDVLAGLDWGLASTLEDTVGTESVELFLRLHSGESLQDEVLHARVADLEAVDVVGDVGNQAGKEGDLEKLVEGDELEAGDITRGQCRWRTSVRQGAVCLQLLFDGE